jgi:hypothetical protein
VDQLQHTGDQNLRVSDNMYVFVLNMRKEVLMPTSCKKARLLLKQGRAVVISRFPFTIQLTYQTGENKQEVTCGIDSGYSNIGFSCITSKKELIGGTVELDNSTSKHLIEKKMYRRGRRNKLRYREPRFLNRKRREGWLPPSVKRRYQTHINLINRLKKIILISKVIVEVGNFDIQKLNNPGIEGRDYQQGNLYNYSNVRAFILSREKGLCQLCEKESSKTDKWNLHHTITKVNGGTDKPDDLALLHEKCHIKLHKNNLHNKLNKNKQYKESTFMNIVKNKFQVDLNCELTFGYQTYNKRIKLNLEKSHINDSFVIAGGTDQKRSFKYIVKQKRRNNRSLQLNRRGFKPSIRKRRYKLQPQDLVKIENKIYEVVGTHCCGERVKLKNRKDIAIKKIEWSFNNNSLIF